jgi:hypothetical protein
VKGARGEGRAAPIDAGRWLGRIVGDGIVAASSLEPAQAEGVPDTFAALGTGEAQDGTPLVVGFSPREGGDAVLAALALGTLLAEEGDFQGEVIAVAPQWSAAARRRLGLVGELPFSFRAIAATSLADGNVAVEPELPEERVLLSPAQVAAHLARPADRELFERAASALEGLASKHGGAVRGVGRSVELVVLARRMVELRAEEGGVLLNAILPQKSSTRLSAEGLAQALDQVEGNLRRRLNDRRARDGEERLRARVIPLLATARSLRSLVPWPLGGSDQDALDLAAVDESGLPVMGAIRKVITLPALASILDAAILVRSALPNLLAQAAPPLRLDESRLLLAASSFEAAAARVLPKLSPGFDLFEVRVRRNGECSVASLGAGEATPRISKPETRSTTDAPAGEPSTELEGEEEAADESRQSAPRSRVRRRGGRRRGSARGGAREPGEVAAPEPEPGADGEDGEVEAQAPRFEEISLFDLDEESGNGEAGGREESERRPRGGRQRRRGRRGPGTERDEVDGEPRSAEDSTAQGESASAGRRSAGRQRGRRPRRGGGGAARGDDLEEGTDDRGEALSGDGDAEDPDDPISLAEDIPDFDEVLAPSYDEDEELDEDADPELGQLGLEREKRHRARMAKLEPQPAEVPAPRPLRRRAAVVAHADRDSLLAAVMLARDIRLLEGIWVYPQEELMTFFRSVATDLREETPIYLVGFTPRPARAVIQAASLYRDRLDWFDHHEWPPEDREALKQAIGEEAIHLTPLVGSSLPAVLSSCTRRSRFSDKLVDLQTGRFTQHDHERWGRLWWSRLGVLAGTPGERRSDLDPLLVGRPSDLAKEAAAADAPPPPEEVAFVSGRDFRLVHFAGYSVVVLELPPELDLHLCARIARERHEAPLSLARIEGQELVVLGGEELGPRRSLDLGSLVEHLSSKLDWVEALPDDDHVARLRIRDLASHPERLDEVIGEIAMGRSILEG